MRGTWLKPSKAVHTSAAAQMLNVLEQRTQAHHIGEGDALDDAPRPLTFHHHTVLDVKSHDTMALEDLRAWFFCDGTALLGGFKNGYNTVYRALFRIRSPLKDTKLCVLNGRSRSGPNIALKAITDTGFESTALWYAGKGWGETDRLAVQAREGVEQDLRDWHTILSNQGAPTHRPWMNLDFVESDKDMLTWSQVWLHKRGWQAHLTTALLGPNGTPDFSCVKVYTPHLDKKATQEFQEWLLTAPWAASPIETVSQLWVKDSSLKNANRMRPRHQYGIIGDKMPALSGHERLMIEAHC